MEGNRDSLRCAFTTRFTVRTYEVDGFLHVNNAVFVQYLEAVRGEFIRALGLGYAKFHEWRAWPVVRRLTITYESPARADDELVVDLVLSELRRAQFTVQYDLRRASDGNRVARAETQHAFTDPSGRIIRVPDAFREAAQRYCKPSMRV